MIPLVVTDSDIGDTNPGLYGAVLIYLPWGIMTLLAARSLKRLRRTKIDKIGITLEQLVRSTQPTSAEGTRWVTARGLKSPGVIRFVAIAVILLLLYAGIRTYLWSVLEEAPLAALFGIWFGLGFYRSMLFSFARSHEVATNSGECAVSG